MVFVIRFLYLIIMLDCVKIFCWIVSKVGDGEALVALIKVLGCG